MTISTLITTTRRPLIRLVSGCMAAAVLAIGGGSRPIVEAQGNPVMVENMNAGAAGWDIGGAGDPDVQGFATDISVNVGQTVRFKIAAPGATLYSIKIYRLGYYNGDGAREVATISPSASLPQSQPACNGTQFGTTGLVDCGNWAESASWSVPANAVSGVYIAKPTRLDNNHTSHIVFVVRDDSRTADIVFQTSDTTWQAYNQYPGVGAGGASLYCGGPVSSAGTEYSCPGRATKVSYNRPFDTRAHDPQSFLFNAEYPMLRWLEANGYDVKYQTGVDTDRRALDLTGLHKPKVFMSVGHDEYWSAAQRATVQNARNAGVNLAFFSGNEMYWKTRFEPSVDGSNTPYRTLVSYKETLANAKIDPAVDPVTGVPIWTGTWRDPRFSPPADGGRPENGLIGQIWTVNCCEDAIRVPAEMGQQRFWRNTRVASLPPGQVATMPAGTLGYEWDEDLDNGFRPSGLVRMSLTSLSVPEKLTDFGSHVGPGTATHALTLYRHNSGALVFGAGTVQWSWGLDSQHDRGVSTPDQAMQQATVNLLTDMGAAPGTLQIGADPTRPLQGGAPSSDMFAPTSSILSPAPAAQVPSGARLTISGSAADIGGGAVAGVEVSVDGGTTWHPATGAAAWSYDWTPGSLGSAVIRTRAIDDSGNLEAAGPGIAVMVVQGDCPCTSLWKPSTVPPIPDFGDGTALELGVKFKSDIDGYITGIRYYKSVANSGTHVGNLWKIDGTQLATATFAGESQSGWQQVLFATPVAITANTTYIASYHTNVGHYAATPGYFTTASVDSPPLHALATGVVGGNGVFAVGDSAFPSNTFNAGNYWVDVVFATTTVDSVAPVISNLRATTIDSAKVVVSWTTNEPAASRLEYSTDFNFPPGNTAVINASSFAVSHSIVVANLTPNSTYYYRVTATDAAGNSETSAAPSFTVPGPTLRDTALADFLAGTQQDTYAGETVDGEVMLSPVSGSEFSGPGLPAGWIAVPWGPGGFSMIDNGVLVVDGARVATCVIVDGACAAETTTTTASATFAAPRTLEFSARFSGDQFQHAGFGVTFGSGSEPWAIFSTLNGGALFARTNNGQGGNIDTFIGAGLLGQFHRYRIDWNAASVDYYIDGLLVVSHPLTLAGPMRPVAASDFNIFGGDVFIDWMRLSPYAATGVFTSRVFDATQLVDWHSIQWASTLPAGTSLEIAVRTGNVAIPDGTWTAFAPIASAGPLALQSRFIQYRATMASANPTVTPLLEDIIISTGHAPVANPDSGVVKENGSHTFAAAGPGSLIANDTDDDPTDMLRVVSVTGAAHGTTTLNGDGSVTYTPAANYSGADAFSYVVSDGLLTATGSVSLDVRFGNVAPVANGDFYTVDEDSAITVPSVIGVLNNDTDVEHDTLTAILVSVPAHGLLTFAGNGGFTYTPAPNYAGPDSFQYKANDSVEDSNIVTVSILVNQVNDAPITEADSYTAVLNQPLDVLAAFNAGLGRYVSGVLANDRDVEVEDTAPLHAELVSTVAHGTLTFSADGSFSYLPGADFLGIDSFTYRAIDHLDAPGAVRTVTLTVAIKAVSQAIAGGATLSTGNGVSAGDPLQSAVTSPAAGTVSIAQGVISAGQSPTGYTFLNQQVNITITGADGSEVMVPASSPIRLVFTIDQSLIPAGQNHLTFQMFRNGVLIPECPGAATIPAANLDPCVTAREDLSPGIRLAILTSHASRWNMGLPTAVLGDSPVARDDAFTVDFQAPIVRPAPGVLGNDYGMNSLTAALSGTPYGGTVNLAASGAFTFVPDAGFCGIASFHYKAHDGAVESNEGTVSLTVDCTPHAGDDAITVAEDSGTSTITVLANDTDPDPGQTLRVTDVTQGAHGAVAMMGAGMAVTYTPAPDFFGTDSFTYTVSDGHNGSATATVTVTVTAVNDVPSFTSGLSLSVSEDAGPQSIAGFATNISAGPANESGQALNFIVSSSNAALFSAAPAIAADGTLIFTAAADANGAATVTVRLHDDGGTANGGVDTSAPQTFVITVTAVNDAPVAANAALTTNEDTPASGTLIATDVDHDALVFSIVGSPANGTVVITDSATGAFTYTPNANANGPDSFTFKVSDGSVDSGVATVSVAIGAVNDVPVASDGTLAVVEDTPATGTLSASDVENQPLVYAIVGAAGKGVVTITNPSTGAYSYAPNQNANGSDSFTFRVFDGTDYSAAATVSVTIAAVNDAPAFTRGPNQAVLEDSGARSVAAWATGASAGAADESAQALTFVVSNDNPGLFASQPAIAPNGTLTFTPAANANGTATVSVELHDNGGTDGGGADTSAAQTFTIDVTAVNDVPSFTKGADQTRVGQVGAQTVTGWATDISAGPANEAAQALNFIVSNTNTALFSAQPAVAANGTLTFTPTPNVFGTSTVTVQVHDNDGVANGGADTSAARTFTITIAKASTTTVVTSSNSPSLFGVPITLTATVNVVAPGIGAPAGTVTFKDGTTSIGSAALSNGSASITTSTLSIATHSITAVYGGNPSFQGSTSPAFSQVIQPSATISVNFAVHAMLDTSNKPKVQDIAVTGAQVQVYTRRDTCTDGQVVSNHSSRWGRVFDGADGPGGADSGCPVVSLGAYKAVATTDANGNASIIVPPTSSSPNTDYIVIGRATTFDYIRTASSPDPLYSEYTMSNINASQAKKAPLHQLATFNGKIVPGKQTEYFGSYLDLVEPEAVTWTENEELYPFVLITQGSWDVTTGVTPPEGFVPDQPVLSTTAADTTTAIQFTLTDIGSDWTETTVNHSIVHLGATTNATSTIPMIDKKATVAKNDNVKVMHDSGANVLLPMANDKVNHLRKPITITAIAPALNGTVELAADGLSVRYAPVAGFSGVDTFTYTITDAIGDTSTGTVTVTVLDTPSASVRNVNVPEGDNAISNPTVNVVLSNQSLLPVTVSYATAPETATAGADYTPVSGTVTFEPGETSKPIALAIAGDTLAEDHETFRVTIADTTNATIAAAPGGLVTIQDDDPPEVTIAAAASITEGNTGSKNVALVLTLSQTHPESVWVNYATSPGTASAGSDYIHTTGTAQFLPGTLTKTIFLPVLGDTVGEPSETFYVDISGPLNATLTAETQATVTIVNDDTSSEVFSTSADLSAGTLAGGATLSETVDGEITLATLQGTEFSGAAIPAGWTSTALVSDGTAGVAAGKLAIDGAALLGPTPTAAAGQTLEFSATFTAVNQSIGFGGSPALVSPMAMFTVRGNMLYARTINGAKTLETAMAGLDWLRKPHRYQITTTAQNASYYVDGTLMISHTSMAWGTASMRPAILDSTTGDAALSVDWIRSGPYAASGSYTSSVFDAGSAVAWQKVTSSNTIAPYVSCCGVTGTTTAISYRMGDTPTPDASWTAFTAVGTGGAATGSARYVQFMVQMTSTTGAKTPVVQDVTVVFKRP